MFAHRTKSCGVKSRSRLAGSENCNYLKFLARNTTPGIPPALEEEHERGGYHGYIRQYRFCSSTSFEPQHKTDGAAWPSPRRYCPSPSLRSNSVHPPSPYHRRGPSGGRLREKARCRHTSSRRNSCHLQSRRSRFDRLQEQESQCPRPAESARRSTLGGMQ